MRNTSNKKIKLNLQKIYLKKMVLIYKVYNLNKQKSKTIKNK